MHRRIIFLQLHSCSSYFLYAGACISVSSFRKVYRKILICAGVILYEGGNRRTIRICNLIPHGTTANWGRCNIENGAISVFVYPVFSAAFWLPYMQHTDRWSNKTYSYLLFLCNKLLRTMQHPCLYTPFSILLHDYLTFAAHTSG